MKNIYSPYQQRKRGIIPRIYSKADVLRILEKIEKIKNYNGSKKELAKDMLETQKDNLEFTLRQLNQQNLEGL